MQADGRQTIRFLVFGASLRKQSLNDRLASLAAACVERKGASVDLAHMTDFDCPSYDQDLELEEGDPDRRPAAARPARRGRRLHRPPASIFALSFPSHPMSQRAASGFISRPA